MSSLKPEIFSEADRLQRFAYSSRVRLVGMWNVSRGGRTVSDAYLVSTPPSRSTLRVVIIAIAIVAIGYIAVSPYVTLYEFGQALRHSDANRVASMVDFPAVRESMKASIGAMMIRQMKESRDSNNPFAAAGLAIMTPIVNGMIDTMVTPAGLVAMMKSGKMPRSGESYTETAETSPTSSSGELPKFDVHYASWARFAVDLRYENRAVMKAQFCRSNLFWWKLCDIEMPDLGQ